MSRYKLNSLLSGLNFESIFEEKNLNSTASEAMKIETEAVVRRSVIRFAKARRREDILLKALDDFDWEVKEIALKYWARILVSTPAEDILKDETKISVIAAVIRDHDKEYRKSFVPILLKLKNNEFCAYEEKRNEDEEPQAKLQRSIIKKET